MLDKIISGGQSGADQGAWHAAQAFAIRTGGWMPRGFLTAEGPRPAFAQRYGASEMHTESYPARTERNVVDSDGTLWFGETTTSGAHETVGACRKFGKPLMLVYPAAAFEPWHVARWIVTGRIGILNVAGNREEDEPGIGHRVELFLCQVLEQTGHVRR
jgi:hypothetical protein